ncbi:MAG: aminotransferase class V-fold PLP-dependent enzyme [Fimbriimonadaceae bacterium]
MSQTANPFTTDERERIRSRFSRVLERPEIYLAHHSLGLPPDELLTSLTRFADLWYTQMDLAWKEWINEINRFCANTAALIGMEGQDCVVMKTSCGQSLRAVLNALPRDESLRPINIVATRGEFDSIDFILKMYQDKGRAKITWVEPKLSGQGMPLFDAQDIVNAITPDTDLVITSLVMFNTGQVLNGWDEIAAKAKECNAYLLGDAYHAVGVIPVDLAGFDFLMGGSYKYTPGRTGSLLAYHQPTPAGIG